MKRSSVQAVWLYAAITSIMFMGIYAFLVALSRAPGLNELFPSQDFFRVALVTHVVLSVVIWFLAFILYLVYRITASTPSGPLDYIPAFGAFLGIALIVITPFTGPVSPMLNNYVPVIDHWLYLGGVWVVLFSSAAGFALRAPALIRLKGSQDGPSEIVYGSLLAAGVALYSGIACFAVAWWQLKDIASTLDRRLYYESLFWGGGHVLQFANSLGVMAAWGLLAVMAGKGGRLIGAKVIWGVLGVMTLFAIGAPLEYFFNDAVSQEARTFYFELKRWGAGLGPILLCAAILFRPVSGEADPVASRGLNMSLFLFALGGVIALTLQGSDTRAPAHYHGVIGAVTLGFMTIALTAARDAGWLKANQWWLKLQATLYGAGQSVFVAGLFVGGLAGLPRKTFGAAQELDNVLKKTGMGLMGIGGLLAVTAGIIFVVLMLRSFFSRTEEEAPA